MENAKIVYTVRELNEILTFLRVIGMNKHATLVVVISALIDKMLEKKMLAINIRSINEVLHSFDISNFIEDLSNFYYMVVDLNSRGRLAREGFIETVRKQLNACREVPPAH